jgi:uncharacterized protein
VVSQEDLGANEPLQAADLILLLLRAPDPHPNRLDGITRLEKLLYLLERETDIRQTVDDPFSFRPYHYGPYSREVYEAVDLLEEARLVREERVLEGNTLDEAEAADALAGDREGVERRFYLTDDGQAVAELLRQRHPQAYGWTEQFKRSYGHMPLRQLIRYVYSKYPESAERSRIRDQVT